MRCTGVCQWRFPAALQSWFVVEVTTTVQRELRSSLRLMRNYVWTGEISPAEGANSLEYTGRFDVNLGESFGRIVGWIQIRGSRCNIRVAADAIIGPQQLANNIRSAAAGIIDALGFVDGHGRVFALGPGRDLDTGQDYFWSGTVPEVALEPGLRDDQLRRLLEAFPLTPLLGDALADYRRAILEPWDSGFYAYRCVETIQRFWQGDSGRSSTRTWEAMREGLEIARESLNELKRAADLQRHGGRRSITPEEHTRLLVVAKDALLKFVNYLLSRPGHDQQ